MIWSTENHQFLWKKIFIIFQFQFFGISIFLKTLEQNLVTQFNNQFDLCDMMII